MAVQLPFIAQPLIDPKTGLINSAWYLALLNISATVSGAFVSSINLIGNNGITVAAASLPITSVGVITLGIGNLTCANARIAGTVTSANVVATANITAVNIAASGVINTANEVATGTITAANVVATGSVSTATVTAVNLLATGTVTSANAIVTGTVSTANLIATSGITSVDIALSGSFRVGNAFVASVTTAAGWITVQDSSGTTFKVLCQR